MASILDLSPENLSPGMRQYQEAKRENPDCLIMLRMGDFYEMFYEDAETASEELEITLTARGKGEKKAPLAGIPYHALDNYLGRLIKKGHKVAIVEQLEDPQLAKGIVKRGLMRIVTPGTIIESSLLEENENNYLLALTSARSSSTVSISSPSSVEYALAFCDLSTGEFFTSNLDNETVLWNELSKFNPQECLIPVSLGVNKELVAKLKQKCALNTLDDYYFKPEKAKELLLNHFHLSSLASFGLEEKTANISVCGALLSYLIQTQKNNLTHLKKISLRSNQQKMLLDATTFRNLELVCNMRTGSPQGTLLNVIDQTVTAMGARLIRSWLKAPLLDRHLIEKRWASLQELNQQVIVREEIIEILSLVSDLERLISRVNYGNASPRDLLALKRSLEQMPLLKEKLSKFECPLLKEASSLPDLTELAQLIEEAILEEAPLTIREGKIIKPGFHQELAELYNLKSNSTQYLQQLEEKEKSKTGITNLKISYTRVFGYFIEITKRNLSLVPDNYIRKQTTANSERYITEELKQEEERILGAEEKIIQLEYSLFQELLQKIAAQTELIQEASCKIAVLDVLCSLAQVAMKNNYVKPTLVEKKVLQIKNGRHPVLELIEENYIKNDLFLGQGEMMIITGPNMAGKSSVMRQTALIVLLAQMGSFVPAEEVVMGIVDRIFTRVGAADDLSSGQSTFMMEMNETAAILHGATEDSLVILDEIGRGTSTYDGVSLAWSVAEHLHQRIKVKTLFATHYHILNKLTEKFTKIKNYNVAVKENKGEIIFLRKLIAGGTDQSYGIHVAKLAGLPSEVVERAKEIQSLLEKDDEMMRKIKVKKIQEQLSLEKF